MTPVFLDMLSKFNLKHKIYNLSHFHLIARVDQNSCAHTIALSGHLMYEMLPLTSKEEEKKKHNQR